MKKRILALLLALAMLAGVVPAALAADGTHFTDVAETDWFAEAVEFAHDHDPMLMGGVSATEFDPNGTANRAMVVRVLWNLAGQPKAENAAPFTDLTADWYRDAVAWAVENDVVNGMTATTFAPEDPATREQVATLLWRFVGAPKTEKDALSSRADAAEVSAFAADAMNWAVGAKVLNGRYDNGENRLAPKAYLTRAEFAQLLLNLLEKCETGDHFGDVQTELRDAKEPTCLEAGYSGNTYCTLCGALVRAGEIVPAKGHTWDEGEEQQAADCENAGITLYTCTVCGATRLEAEDAKGHTPVEVALQPATCTAPGHTAGHRCEVCGAILDGIEEIPMVEHTPGEPRDVKAATCTTAGYTGNIYCEKCDQLLSAGEPVEALGHNFVNNKCTRCDAALVNLTLVMGGTRRVLQVGAGETVTLPTDTKPLDGYTHIGWSMQQTKFAEEQPQCMDVNAVTKLDKDTVLYAVYAIEGEARTNYDYSHDPDRQQSIVGEGGSFALLGMDPYTQDGLPMGARFMIHPFALGQDAQPVRVTSLNPTYLVENTYQGEGVPFQTSDPSIRLEIQKIAEGKYTVQNQKGEYLTWDGERAVTFEKDLKEEGVWRFFPYYDFNDEIIRNDKDPDKFLSFNFDSKKFEVFSEQKDLYTLPDGRQLPMYVYYHIFVYKATDTRINVNGYTTEPQTEYVVVKVGADKTEVDRVHIGRTYTYPTPEWATANYVFTGWSDSAQKRIEKDQFKDDMVHAAGTTTVVTGDMTIYALYAYGTPLTRYTYNDEFQPEQGAYAGDYAISGYGLFVNDEVLLKSDGSTVDVHDAAELDREADDNDSYNSSPFNSTQDDIKFTIEAAEDGYYTIKNSSGQYLAFDGEGAKVDIEGDGTVQDGKTGITFKETADDNAMWKISQGSWNSVTMISNKANSNMILCAYDGDYSTLTFIIIDGTTEDIFNEDIFANLYYAFLFNGAPYVKIEYYTTSPEV